MIDNCIICNKNLKVGDFAPENWFLCVDCYEKGYRICEADKKIFNVNEKSETPFKIDNLHTFKIGEHDLLEDIAKRIKYNAMKVCDNKCFNLLYINECITELQVQLNMIETEELIPILQTIKINEEKRQQFKINLNNKINELEKCRKKYI